MTRTGITGLVAVAPATLTTLVARENKIVDLTPPANHAALVGLDLAFNTIVSVHPSVDAPFWAGRCVHLDVLGNPLGAEALDVDLPALCAGGDAIAFADQTCDDCSPKPLTRPRLFTGR